MYITEMIWPIIFTVILVALSIKIHGLTLNYLSQNTSKKFIYKDFVKISGFLIGSHLVQIILFAFYYYIAYQTNADQNLFGGNLSGSFLDFFYYSINCYTTLGTGDIFANGSMRIATGLEALIGLVLIAWTATFKLSYLFKK
ncbi:ion channel [Candidatus Pelagibacter sp.]|uniref:ion channel n=1 Tax=Candidatus Pelagibacter sp. TaxID=2024849 RepID=UPI003D110100